MYMDLIKAEKHIKNAVRVGYYILIISVILIAYMFYDQTQDKPNPYHAIISLIILFALIYGTSRKIKLSVILLFAYYLYDRVDILLFRIINYGPSYFSFKDVVMVIIEIIISYYLFQGIRGTFAYHRLVNESKPESADIDNIQ